MTSKEEKLSIFSKSHEIDGFPLMCCKALKDPEELSSLADFSKRRVFIRNIKRKTTDEDIQNHFSMYGEVESAYVVKVQSSKKPRSFGFVTFTSKEPAQKLIEIGQVWIGGHEIVIHNFTNPQNTVHSEDEMDLEGMPKCGKEVSKTPDPTLVEPIAQDYLSEFSVEGQCWPTWSISGHEPGIENPVDFLLGRQSSRPLVDSPASNMFAEDLYLKKDALTSQVDTSLSLKERLLLRKAKEAVTKSHQQIDSQNSIPSSRIQKSSPGIHVNTMECLPDGLIGTASASSCGSEKTKQECTISASIKLSNKKALKLGTPSGGENKSKLHSVARKEDFPDHCDGDGERMSASGQNAFPFISVIDDEHVHKPSHTKYFASTARESCHLDHSITNLVFRVQKIVEEN